MLFGLWAGPDVDVEKDSYEAAYAAVEGLYLGLLERHPHGPGFRTAWEKGRRETLAAHGWTEQDFYAELDRRRLTQSPSDSPG